MVNLEHEFNGRVQRVIGLEFNVDTFHCIGSLCRESLLQIIRTNHYIIICKYNIHTHTHTHTYTLVNTFQWRLGALVRGLLS